MKLRDIIKSASSNLWRSKGRTILTIVAIFIGAFTISLTTGVNTGVNNYIDKQINSVGGEDQLVITAGASSSNQSDKEDSDAPNEYHPEKGSSAVSTALTDKDLDIIKKIDGIKAVKPFSFIAPDYITGKTNKKYELTLAGPSDIHIDLETGHSIKSAGDAYEINIAPNYVKSLGYQNAKDATGQIVKIGVTSQATGQQQVIEATITGVRTVSLTQNGQSIASQALADKITEISEEGLPANMKNKYQAAFATMEKSYVGNQDKITGLKEELTKESYSGQTVEDEIGIIRQVVNAVTGVLTMFGAIALLAASFGIINTLYMSVQDRTREIGLMKAMGTGSGKVFLTFSVEALLIGFWGSLLGILGAFGTSQLVNQLATTSFLKGLTGFTLIQFSVPSMLSIVGIIMLIAFLAGTFPATRASRMDPINALRYE